MIMADVWLFDLAERGAPQMRVAGTLLRTQIRAFTILGHALDLSSEQTRRAIVHSSHWGSVPKQSARCLNCGCEAPLTWWARLDGLSRDGVAAAQTQVGVLPNRWKYLFIMPCPGREYAMAMLEVTSAPEERSE